MALLYCRSTGHIITSSVLDTDSIRTVFMGTPTFAVPALEALIDSGYRVVGAYTQPDRGSGRGRKPVESPVKELARRRGIPVYQPASFKMEDTVAEVVSLEPNLIVVAAYGLILPQAVLEIPSHDVLNVHPSLLPRHRGPSPVAGALLAGDETTGVTIMLVEMRVDAGPILSQTEVPVQPDDNAGSLTEKLAHRGADLLVKTLPGWLGGEIEPRVQDDSQATHSRIIKKGDGEIDWSLPAEDIRRRIRAFDPWPGAFTRWQGKRLKVLDAIPLPDAPQLPLGSVYRGSNDNVSVGTGTGSLALRRVQLEGRRPVDVDAFVRGYPTFRGSLLPS